MPFLVQALYLDLEDLKASKSDAEKTNENEEKEESGCISHPGAESDFWPTMLKI